MTHSRFLVAVFICLTLVATATGPLAQSRDEIALRAAIETETIKGDLTSAIAQYQQLSTSGDRTVAAAALLQMAGCYERLGKPEARPTYQRIVTEYGDIGAVTVSARMKLAALDQKGQTLVAKRVWGQSGTGYYASYTTVSADGRYLAYTDWNTGHLGIRDLATGQETDLTPDAQATQGYAEEKIFSRDGNAIVYGWENDRGDDYEMRIITRLGGKPRIIAPPGRGIFPWGWSPDGKHILAEAGGGLTLHWVSATDGASRILKTFEKAGNITLRPRNYTLSPDGRFVAYDRPVSSEQRERDVYVLAVETGEEMSLRPHPAVDRMLGWFPDGGRILFASDRGNTWDLWSIRVTDGKAQGEAVLISSNTGRITPQGFTQSGDFYYGRESDQEEVYIATLDVTGRHSVNLTRVVSRFEAFKSQAAWSSDGAQLVYLQDRTVFSPEGVRLGPIVQGLAVQTLATGEVRPLKIAMSRMQNPVWRDARSLIVQGADLQNQAGLFLVDIESGVPTRITSRGARPVLSPSGKELFFLADRSIVARDLESGSERVVIAAPFTNFAVSPDGQWIAASRQGTGAELNVFMFPAAGGEPRRIASFPVGFSRGFPMPVAWSSGGRSVLAAVRGAGGAEVWQIPIDGSAPQSTGIVWSGALIRISVHSDGRRLALSTDQVSQETWVLQNLAATTQK